MASLTFYYSKWNAENSMLFRQLAFWHRFSRVPETRVAHYDRRALGHLSAALLEVLLRQYVTVQPRGGSL